MSWKDQEREAAEKKEPKCSGLLYKLWLVLLAAALGGCALLPQTSLPLGVGKTTALVLLVFLDFLYLLTAVTGSVWRTGQIPYETAAAAGRKVCRRYGVRQFLIYLAATLLFLAYSFMPAGLFQGGSIIDSLVGSACICLASFAAVHLPLRSAGPGDAADGGEKQI